MTVMSQPRNNLPPRRHHHVPRFYLAQFSDDGTKTGQLAAFDLELHRHFPTNVEDAAVEKDFYKSKFRDGRDPMSIEVALARLEDDLAVTFLRVIQQRAVEPQDLSDILNYVTLQIVRGPKQRQMSVDAVQLITLQMMDKTVSSPVAWKDTVNRLRDDGDEVPPIPYAAAKRFVEQRRFKTNVDIPNTHHIETLAKMSDPILKLLARRTWRIAQTAEGCELITSDTPVGIVGFTGTGRVSIGFGTPNTMVVVPLTPHLLLYGCFGNVPIETPIPRDKVALINTTLLCASHRFLYARSKHFFLRADPGVVPASIEVIKTLREKCTH
jgi:Protein of unknown function (DUF4238)